MKPPARALSPRSRDLAVDRIRSITMTTAVAGMIGTGAFGALAAVNYSGTAASTGSGTDGTNGVVNGSTTQDDTRTDDATTNRTTTSGFDTAPRAVSSSRRSHVSSGGS